MNKFCEIFDLMSHVIQQEVTTSPVQLTSAISRNYIEQYLQVLILNVSNLMTVEVLKLLILNVLRSCFTKKSVFLTSRNLELKILAELSIKFYFE